MPEDWMVSRGEFVDPHGSLRPFSEILRLLTAVEQERGLKEYFEGYNAGGRCIFQVFSTEFVQELADAINSSLKQTQQRGPVLEVMSGDGVLTDFLKPLVGRDIIATDAKSPRYKISYTKSVERIEALEATQKYRPAFVFMSWEPYLSMDAVEIAKTATPMAWIGERPMCGHPDLFEIEHVRLHSRYAIGRHDSPLNGRFSTDVYLFNCSAT